MDVLIELSRPVSWEEIWLNWPVSCWALAMTACRCEMLEGEVVSACKELKKLDRLASSPFGLLSAPLVETLVTCSPRAASAYCRAVCWALSEPVTPASD